jgi:hypothetical protein
LFAVGGWISSAWSDTPAWVRPFGLIEKKLKDVGFSSFYLSSQKGRTIARIKALVSYLTLLFLISVLEKGSRTDNRRNLQ